MRKSLSSTTDPSIVCAPQVCVGNVKLYSSVRLCKQKYSSSVQVVYSSTVYLYMNLYTLGYPERCHNHCFYF
jgi:hypothetical protein